jgi:hypothetical protein
LWTNGSRSVSMVRLRTQATFKLIFLEFSTEHSCEQLLNSSQIANFFIKLHLMESIRPCICL